jgi:hypothetical protein
VGAIGARHTLCTRSLADEVREEVTMADTETVAGGVMSRIAGHGRPSLVR